MSVIVTHDDTVTTIRRGASWTVGQFTGLTVLDDEKRPVAAFRHWDVVHVPDPAVRCTPNCRHA